jgi:hypothetical protein
MLFLIMEVLPFQGEAKIAFVMHTLTYHVEQDSAPRFCFVEYNTMDNICDIVGKISSPAASHCGVLRGFVTLMLMMVMWRASRPCWPTESSCIITIMNINVDLKLSE